MAKRTSVKKVAGYVWCDTHSCIHEDSTDPYGMGEPDCEERTTGQCWCAVSLMSSSAK
jgi:hypothetical protein